MTLATGKDDDLQFWDTNYHHAQFVYFEGTGNGDDRWTLQCRCGFWTLVLEPGHWRAQQAQKRHDALDPWMTPMSHRDTRRKAKRLKVQRRPWRVHFDLAYDGGGSEWDGFYRTLPGARWSMFWQRHFPFSWGGSATLHRNLPPEGTP